VNTDPCSSLPPAGPSAAAATGKGQSPDTRTHPGVTQIREALLLLQSHWKRLRLYDCTPHAQRMLEVIRQHGLDFQAKQIIHP